MQWACFWRFAITAPQLCIALAWTRQPLKAFAIFSACLIPVALVRNQPQPAQAGHFGWDNL